MWCRIVITVIRSSCLVYRVLSFFSGVNLDRTIWSPSFLVLSSWRHFSWPTAKTSRSSLKNGVYPGFPTLFWGLSVFFVGDLMGKALWKLVENAARFPRRGGRVLCVHGAVSFHRARPCGPRWLPAEGGHASCRAGPPRPRTAVDPMNNYVHVKTADLYRPNARLTPERQGYQVLTPFGKLGYSLKNGHGFPDAWYRRAIRRREEN